MAVYVISIILNQVYLTLLLQWAFKSFSSQQLGAFNVNPQKLHICYICSGACKNQLILQSKQSASINLC